MNPAANDSLAEWRDQGRQTIRENSEAFRSMVAKARQLAEAGRHDAAAIQGCAAAYHAQYRHAGLFTSFELENVLLAIGRATVRGSRSTPARTAPAAGPNKVLHVSTKVSGFGGPPGFDPAVDSTGHEQVALAGLDQAGSVRRAGRSARCGAAEPGTHPCAQRRARRSGLARQTAPRAGGVGRCGRPACLGAGCGSAARVRRQDGSPAGDLRESRGPFVLAGGGRQRCRRQSPGIGPAPLGGAAAHRAAAEHAPPDDHGACRAPFFAC